MQGFKQTEVHFFQLNLRPLPHFRVRNDTTIQFRKILRTSALSIPFPKSYSTSSICCRLMPINFFGRWAAVWWDRTYIHTTWSEIPEILAFFPTFLSSYASEGGRRGLIPPSMQSMWMPTNSNYVRSSNCSDCAGCTTRLWPWSN